MFKVGSKIRFTQADLSLNLNGETGTLFKREGSIYQWRILMDKPELRCKYASDKCWIATPSSFELVEPLGAPFYV